MKLLAGVALDAWRRGRGSWRERASLGCAEADAASGDADAAVERAWAALNAAQAEVDAALPCYDEAEQLADDEVLAPAPRPGRRAARLLASGGLILGALALGGVTSLDFRAASSAFAPEESPSATAPLADASAPDAGALDVEETGRPVRTFTVLLDGTVVRPVGTVARGQRSVPEFAPAEAAPVATFAVVPPDDIDAEAVPVPERRPEPAAARSERRAETPARTRSPRTRRVRTAAPSGPAQWQSDVFGRR